MPSKKSRQQAKMTRQKILNGILWALLFSAFLFFLLWSIHNVIICHHINSKDLEEYSGTYTIRKEHRLRNTIYFITLENGDVLRLTPELLKDDLDFTKSSALRFTYCEPEFGLLAAYICVEICSIDGEVCYLETEASLNEATMGATIAILLSVLLLAVAVFALSLFFLIPGDKGKVLLSSRKRNKGHRTD